MPKISIVIPAYNEEATIQKVLERVACECLSLDWNFEIIVVDDASQDNTFSLVSSYKNDHPNHCISLYQHEKNAGKGAALHTAFSNVTGDIILIQDADFEYDPSDYAELCQPILQDKADMVYGSRFVGGKPHRALFFWHLVANKFLTQFSNVFTNLNLTDMETGYKAFKTDILQHFTLKEKRFGFEPEFTIKASRVPGIRIFEIGIAYYGRTYEDGKKIGLKDGVWALICIIKYGLWK